MQSEHRLALTKNYVLLLNETPVDDILDELRQQQIVNEDQRECIAQQFTHKGRTRALLELLPRRGPKAFHAFCYALLTRNKNELVSVLADPDKEDMAVCFPGYSSFHLGDRIYLNVDGDHIELKRGMIVVDLPLLRWKMFETYLEDVDETVEQIRNNRYASLKRHIGGNVYVSAESSALTIYIRHHWLSPVDLCMHPTPQGVTLDVEQYEKLKDVDKLLPTVLPELKNMLPCQLTHQNVEGTTYCSECNPDGLES